IRRAQERGIASACHVVAIRLPAAAAVTGPIGDTARQCVGVNIGLQCTIDSRAANHDAQNDKRHDDTHQRISPLGWLKRRGWSSLRARHPRRIHWATLRRLPIHRAPRLWALWIGWLAIPWLAIPWLAIPWLGI